MATAALQAARARYNRRRRHHIANGTWNPWGDLAAVRAHINDLIDADWTPRAIARAAGTSDRTIRDIRSGQQRRITTANADKILAIAPRQRVGYIPAAGVQRRLRALAVQGHGLRTIEAATGIHHSTLSAMRQGDTRWVQPRLARAITAAYDRLRDHTPATGNVRKIQLAAHRNGWHPHAAWTCHTIDDPGARPLGTAHAA